MKIIGKNNLKDGFGKIIYNNEDKFYGSWVNDVKEGEELYNYQCIHL